MSVKSTYSQVKNLGRVKAMVPGKVSRLFHNIEQSIQPIVEPTPYVKPRTPTYSTIDPLEVEDKKMWDELEKKIEGTTAGQKRTSKTDAGGS